MALKPTRQFVAYHSVELMGGPLPKGKRYHMLSRRPVKHVQDHTVWVIEGRSAGRTKQYRLKQRIDVDTVEEIDDEYFRFRYSGRHGVDFSPAPLLSDEPWFKDFMKSVANFSIGVTTLKPEFRQHFERMTGRGRQGRGGADEGQ